MHINDLTSRQLKVFHNRLARALGVRFYHSGVISWLMRMAYDRLIAKYLPIPDEVFKLRPFCFKDRIFLPYSPGCTSRTALEQALIAVHECTHALRIRKYAGTVANWYGSYFNPKDTEFRALEEASCKEAEAGLKYWLFGQFGELSLDGYLCSPTAEALAAHSFDRHNAGLMKQGRGYQKHKAAMEAQRILISLGVERTK